MGTTYSERLMRHSAAGQYTYTVPTKKRAIVRFVHASTDPANASVRQWDLYAGGYWLLSYRFTGGIAGHVDELYGIAYAGEPIQLFMYGTSISVMITGYLFDDPTRLAEDAPPIPPDAPVWDAPSEIVEVS